jgi:acyl-CoA reductase-like NAD-dependent aldehyde dehydrogenase
MSERIGDLHFFREGDRRPHFLGHGAPGAYRRMRADHALELADESGHAQACSGHCRRLHHRAEAGRLEFHYSCPAHMNRGYFVRPTVFADVTPEMTIAKEEIFGPVLSIMAYDDEADVAIAGAHSCGLAAYVEGPNLEPVRNFASKMRAGRVYLDGAPVDRSVPFGGYKQSGNGREHGFFGFEEYLEVKPVLSYRTA